MLTTSRQSAEISAPEELWTLDGSVSDAFFFDCGIPPGLCYHQRRPRRAGMARRPMAILFLNLAASSEPAVRIAGCVLNTSCRAPTC
jgi:hypothetical protein